MDPNLALFANDAFYVAFENGDFDAMAGLWARDQVITCMHPGWPALVGREAVLESWERILGNQSAEPVTAFNARAVIIDRLVNVICYERIAGQTLVATNLFALEAGQLRLVHHQAGPCAEPPEPEPRSVQ
ncbi:MAG: nuclear transport factor 2 family protein [Pseudomonadota bacterium]|nr:nuclear transport factor 2 family protein [Pseudomonadota bacterium]